jgi:hypothetical protein
VSQVVPSTRARNKTPDRRSDLKDIPSVYFGNSGGQFIRIGYTTNLDRRLSQHRASKNGFAFEFEYLCALRASKADESALHRYFDFCHKDGNEKDVFCPSGELVEYIRWLRDQYFVWVPDDPQCDDIAEHAAVDATLWMPNSERKKEKPKRQKQKQFEVMADDFGPFDMPPRELTGDDFYTNPDIIAAARETLGAIDLDPASHPVANRKVKATRFFNIHDNGLLHEWAGRVWLNPPFSQWQSWVPKIIHEWESGRIEAMCVLCASRTLTAQYFEPIHVKTNAMVVLRGRIPFWGGVAGPSPDDGHVVFYFGPDVPRFCESFSSLGTVYLR